MSAKGMTTTILATQLAEAVSQDEAGEEGGFNLGAGMFGRHVSGWIRYVAKELSDRGVELATNRDGSSGTNTSELDEDSPLWLVNEQIKGLLEGDGASEDHEDVLAFLRRTGLPEDTVKRMHRAIVHGDVKSSTRHQQRSPAVEKATRECIPQDTPPAEPILASAGHPITANVFPNRADPPPMWLWELP